jgi:thermitase
MTNFLRTSGTAPFRIGVVSFMFLIAYLLVKTASASGFVQNSGSSYIQKQQTSTGIAEFVEAEVLVKFKSGVKTQAQRIVASNLGARSFLRVGKESGMARVKLPDGTDVITAIEAYQTDPTVEYAQPNYIYHVEAIPNDASYGQLWGLRNAGQIISNSGYTTNNPGNPGFDIDAESAWDFVTDCRSAVVAVLDTGINYTHQDLTGNLWDGSGSGFPNHGFDFIDNDNDPMPTGGGEDHGTHVAGTIGAVGDNGIGVAGVCWQASIMSVRVLNASGFGTTAGIISGIEFASDNGAKVINMSLSGESPFDFLFNEAITYARDRDVVVVVAAANGGADGLSDDNDGLGSDSNPNTIRVPCNFAQDNLLCIAALDQSYNLASFSNFGATSVDMGAPGTNTLSSIAGPKIIDNFASGWTLTGGWTSGTCQSFSMLFNPANWCTGGGYGINIDDRAFKTFDLSGTGVTATELAYQFVADTEPGFDLLSVAMRGAGGDPFASGGTPLSSGSGSTGGFSQGAKFDISSCNTATCSLGFQLTSDSNIVDRGAAILGFTIDTLQDNSNSYALFNGTSMATPHVAGIAALVRAFNPDYTYAQTVEAIRNGGEVVLGLSGITTTGRSANAMGAIAYIAEPTGLTAVAQ